MWCRFLTFCVLVSFILFVVASCIYGRPSIHLFFHRCCGEDIENDQVIFENFGNNFLKERLVGGDIIEVENGSVFEIEDIGRIADEVRDVLSINDPKVKKWIMDSHVNESDVGDTALEDTVAAEKLDKAVQEKVKNQKEDDHDLRSNEMLEKTTEDATESSHEEEFLNVHDWKHKLLVKVK